MHYHSFLLCRSKFAIFVEIRATRSASLFVVCAMKVLNTCEYFDLSTFLPQGVL